MKTLLRILPSLIACSFALGGCAPSTKSVPSVAGPPTEAAATGLPAPTDTLIPPAEAATATPDSSSTPKSSNTITLTPSRTEDYSDAPCGQVQWIADVTFPDDTEIGPDTVFAKTWRLKNTGRCQWTIETTVDFYAGDRMGAPNEQAIVAEDTIVKPGETVDTTVEMVSPSAAGTYQAYFKVHLPYGSPTGEHGFYADITFWVKIRVVSPAPTPSGSPATTVVTNQKTYSPGMEGSVTAACPAGTVVTGGGFSLWDADMFLRAKLDVYASSMEGNGWKVSGKNNGAKSGILKAYAICLNHPTAETQQVEAKVSVLSTAKATVACPAGSVVTGGGFAGEGFVFKTSLPYENGWQVTAFTLEEGVKDAYVFAVCLTGATANAAPVSVVKRIGRDFSGYAYVECAQGSSISGGGFAGGEESLIVDEASIHGRIWLVHAINFYYDNASFAAHAVCLSVS